MFGSSSRIWDIWWGWARADSAFEQPRLEHARLIGAGVDWIAVAERLGPAIAIQLVKKFARTAREWMRIEGGGHAAIFFAHSRNASKPASKNCASWGRKAKRCARLSPPRAQKRRGLAYPVPYRSGALGEIRKSVIRYRKICSLFRRPGPRDKSRGRVETSAALAIVRYRAAFRRSGFPRAVRLGSATDLVGWRQDANL
jgi:hypothetical protein